MKRIWALVWLVFLLLVAVVGQVIGHRYARVHAESYHDHIGKLISCPTCSLFDDQAEVLLDGLEDVRGLAILGNQLYIIQDHGPLTVLSPSMSKTYPVRSICPEVNCGVGDPGGIVLWHNNILIAEKGQIMEVDQTTGKQEHVQLALFEQPDPVRAAPVGLALASNTLFLTADSVHGMTPKNVRHGSGSLMSLSLSFSQPPARPLRISSNLTHPSGVAVAEEFGPLYVTEEYTDRVVWSVYKYNQCTKAWRRFGELAAVPKDPRVVPSFRGLTLWRGDWGDVIVAAGPAGLYAFGPNGTSLGGMQFDEPVTGIAVSAEMSGNQQQKFVYLAVGHKLCRIGLREPHATEAGPAQNEEPMQKPCPKPTPPIVSHPKAQQPHHSPRKKGAACLCS